MKTSMQFPVLLRAGSCRGSVGFGSGSWPNYSYDGRSNDIPKCNSTSHRDRGTTQRLCTAPNAGPQLIAVVWRLLEPSETFRIQESNATLVEVAKGELLGRVEGRRLHELSKVQAQRCTQASVCSLACMRIYTHIIHVYTYTYVTVYIISNTHIKIVTIIPTAKTIKTIIVVMTTIVGTISDHNRTFR